MDFMFAVRVPSLQEDGGDENGVYESCSSH
jgi:hypothetical protein